MSQAKTGNVVVLPPGAELVSLKPVSTYEVVFNQLQSDGGLLVRDVKATAFRKVMDDSGGSYVFYDGNDVVFEANVGHVVSVGRIATGK